MALGLGLGLSGSGPAGRGGAGGGGGNEGIAGDEKLTANLQTPNSDSPSNSSGISNDGVGSSGEKLHAKTKIRVRRTWYGKKIGVVGTPADGGVGAVGVRDVEEGVERRPAALFAPLYNGVAAALAFGV